jgi:hypothetical protein
MLHKETIEASTLELLTALMQDDALAAFILVGGTALALHVGHRKSIDLDLFSPTAFDSMELGRYMKEKYAFEINATAKNTLTGFINGVKIDLLAHRYPYVEQPLFAEGVRLCSMKDIAAMKLNAITGNGTRIKDFIDVAWLSCKISLAEMLDAYQTKYETNPCTALRSLLYFDDIILDEPVQLTDGSKPNWKNISKRIISMTNDRHKIFSSKP